MRKNSFGQGLAIFFVIIGVLFVIGSIGEASEPKCIKAGCDNKQASGSSYCYLHKTYAMYVLPQPVAPVIKRFRCSDIYSQVASLFISSLFSLRPEV